jgi:hypothetical protein
VRRLRELGAALQQRDEKIVRLNQAQEAPAVVAARALERDTALRQVYLL